MSELKACPFCENNCQVYRKMARCSDLECFLHYTRMPIDEWQTRPIEDSLQMQLDIQTELTGDAMAENRQNAERGDDLLCRLRETVKEIESDYNSRIEEQSGYSDEDKTVIEICYRLMFTRLKNKFPELKLEDNDE
jgi:hypothetical protein